MKKYIILLILLTFPSLCFGGKVKSFKKKGNKLEITITETNIVVEEKTLAGLREKKIKLENIKARTIIQNNNHIARHDADIAEIQSLINQAVALGIPE